MKVMFFEDGCHTAGGTATFVRICAQSFPEYGMQVRVVNFGAPEGEGREEWPSGAVLECGIAECGSVRKQAGVVLREFLRFQPEVVCLNDCFHFHDYHRPLARIFAQRAAVVDLVETGTKTAWYHRRREPILDCLSGMVAISRTAAENTLAHLELPFELRIIPHGLPEFPAEVRARPVAKGGPLVLSHAARLDEGVKRTSDMVRLSAELDRRGIGHELRIFGAGDPTFYHDLIGQLGARSVRLSGPAARKRILGAFAQSDFVLLASVFEGYCLMVLEGMSVGAVPVATRCSSAIEDMIQHGKSGFIVPIGDVGAMADAVESGFREPALLASMSKAARASSERFSAARMAKSYQAFFQEVCGLPRNSRPAAWPASLPLPNEFNHWRCRLPMKKVKQFDTLKATVRSWIKGKSVKDPAYVETVDAVKSTQTR